MLRTDVLRPDTVKGMVKSEIYKPDTFLYFACGGNMLTFRIHMHSPTAEFVAIARLENFRLDFVCYTKFWGGPTPTIVPTANAHVWGVIWRIHRSGLPKLEMYKNMATKRNFVNHVTVSTCHMGQFKCRVYIARTNPLPRGDHDPIPAGRWPSLSLKHVMLLGAIEHGFPLYYINFIRRLRDNGEKGLFEQECILRRYCANPNCECITMRQKISRERLTKVLPSYQKTLDKIMNKKDVKIKDARIITEPEPKDENIKDKKKVKKAKLNFE